jgi:phosphotransferase family enzyme
MSVNLPLADPSFPQLQVAGDPESMRVVFQKHLRPLNNKAYHVRDCRLSRVRYRRGDRCVLQYTLRLAEADTGSERIQWVTGVMYADDKARRKWEKLRVSYPKDTSEIISTFEPFSFIPDLGMLVQVFPYDRRLPTLALLIAEPFPKLESPLLARFGPGNWRTEVWNVEPVRYRAGLGAALRLTVQGQDDATGRRIERRFYAKVYRDEGQGQQTHQVLRELWKQARANGEDFTVARPLAYLSGLRTLLQEEAPGTPLEEILLRKSDPTAALRRVAQALAAFNQGDAPATTRRHLLADQVAVLERARRLLGWACPHLRVEVESIIEGILAGLEEVPLGPTHRDLKPDHIFVDGERTIFIDLDSLAKADPVLDPAYLLARLAAMPALFPIPPERTRTAAREFAEEYFAHVPSTWQERLPYHYAGALLKISFGLFGRQAPDWPDSIATLLDEAKASLAGRVW